jgi:hypothetical protein
MEPMRKVERLIRAVDECGVAVRSLPLLSADRVWDRVRSVGLDELLQFDWTLVGEADGLTADLAAAGALDEVSVAACEARLRTIRTVMADRQRYIEIA